MKVVITIDDSKNAAAVSRVRRMLDAASRNDVVYNGCEFVIVRGEFTTIEDTRGLRDPEVLFAAIQNALAGEDGSDDEYVALPHGGVERSAKSNAQRQAEFRERKLREEKTEVRGIYARPEDHAKVKAAAAQITSQRA